MFSRSRLASGWRILVRKLADRVADRVVREQVAEQWQLDAEDLALDEVLDRPEDLVEAVDDDRRVGQQGEQAR